jgi:hypothetical protein
VTDFIERINRFLFDLTGDLTPSESLEEHFSRLERFSVLVAASGFLFIELSTWYIEKSVSHSTIFITGAGVMLIALPFLLLQVRLRFHIMFYTLFYLLLFGFIYYGIPVIDSSLNRNEDENFLLHIALLLSQVLRPDIKAGLLIIAALIADSLFVHYQSGLSLTGTPRIRLLIFIWLALLVLFCEVILRRYGRHYLDLYQKRRGEEEDLILARQVHKNLFPVYENLERLAIYPHVQPQSQMGGDFFDLIPAMEFQQP